MFMHLHCRRLGFLTFILSSTMASMDTSDFFPGINGNLTKITWAHAVNNHSFLIETLNNDYIMMIEADIVLGKLDGIGYDIPIMGHPPANVSDLSLEAFLSNVKTHNSNQSSIQKGVKLDFKTIEVFEASVDIVRRYDQGKYPIWINADILSGPIKANVTPVNATRFLEKARLFPSSILSIGWTTNYGPNGKGSYESGQIKEMIDVVRRSNVSQQITFPVRAGLAATSLSQMRQLLNEVNNSTLTIWSSKGDNVDVDKLRSLIATAGISRTYVDVPGDLLEKLHLDDLPSGSFNTGANIFVLIVAVGMVFMSL